jgi:hypothetical protein
MPSFSDWQKNPEYAGSCIIRVFQSATIQQNKAQVNAAGENPVIFHNDDRADL